MRDILSSDKKIKLIIIDELKEVAKKYGQPRKSLFVFSDDEEEYEQEDDTPDYQVKLFLSKSGYFKKITPQSLRMASDQKLKESDIINQEIEASNKSEILFFTDKATVYKTKASQFDDTKASLLGDYVPAKLGFEDGESVVKMVVTSDYSGYLIFVFENGKAAKVSLDSYATKTNRKKLANAYSDKSPLVDMFFVSDNADIMLCSSNGRAIVFNTDMMLSKASRDTIGVQTMTLKGKNTVSKASEIKQNDTRFLKYKVKAIPAAGSFLKTAEDPDQMTLD